MLLSMLVIVVKLTSDNNVLGIASFGWRFASFTLLTVDRVISVNENRKITALAKALAPLLISMIDNNKEMLEITKNRIELSKPWRQKREAINCTFPPRNK